MKHKSQPAKSTSQLNEESLAGTHTFSEEVNESGARADLAKTTQGQDPLESFKNFKDKGSGLLAEARTLAAEAVELIPEDLKTQFAEKQKVVVSKLRQNPSASTFAVAAVVGIGAAILTNRLLRSTPSQKGSSANQGAKSTRH